MAVAERVEQLGGLAELARSVDVSGAPSEEVQHRERVVGVAAHLVCNFAPAAPLEVQREAIYRARVLAPLRQQRQHRIFVVRTKKHRICRWPEQRASAQWGHGAARAVEGAPRGSGLMRWPWQPKPEQRSSGGDYSDRILRLYEADAAGTAADHGATAAAGKPLRALSRVRSPRHGWKVPPHVREAVTARFLSQTGRDVLRRGQSMHLIRVTDSGRVSLVPVADWHFHGGDDRESWRLQATSYGPDTSTTRYPSFDGVVFPDVGFGTGDTIRRPWSARVGEHDRAPPERGGALAGR